MVKILAVDDDEPMRRLLTKELPRKGFSVETAPDGDTAFGLIKSNTYDVVLLDIVMPGTDGITLMKKLKTGPCVSGDHCAHRQGHGRDSCRGDETRRI